MNKIKIAALTLLVGALGIFPYEKPVAAQFGTATRGGLYVTNVTTHTQVFSGAGVLFEVQLPTGAAEEYAVVFDTAVRSTSVNLGMFISTQQVSVNLTFQSTTTVTNGALSNVGSARFGGEYGVGIGNGLFIWNPNGKTMSVFWKR